MRMENEAESDAPARSGYISPLLTFVTAIAFLLFANGRYPLAICAWLGPLFMLRFTRGGRVVIRLPLAFLGLSIAFGYQFYGMTPFGGAPIYCSAQRSEARSYFPTWPIAIWGGVGPA